MTVLIAGFCITMLKFLPLCRCLHQGICVIHLRFQSKLYKMFHVEVRCWQPGYISLNTGTNKTRLILPGVQPSHFLLGFSPVCEWLSSRLQSSDATLKLKQRRPLERANTGSSFSQNKRVSSGGGGWGEKKKKKKVSMIQMARPFEQEWNVTGCKRKIKSPHVHLQGPSEFCLRWQTPHLHLFF